VWICGFADTTWLLSAKAKATPYDIFGEFKRFAVPANETGWEAIARK
jgi:hypothetical protein